MKKIKNFMQFLNEDLKLGLLDSIGATKVLMGDVLDFNSERFNNIDVMVNDDDFLKKLDSKGFKKNNMEFTRDCETFITNTVDLKFFLIFKKEDSELDPTPEYIVYQTKPKNSHNWEPIQIYKVNGNIRNFYDKLSSKTIEIKRGGKNYIYRTSNAGNDWSLQNIQNKDAEFKDIMSNDEINNTLRKQGTTKDTVS
jgi:hypothetical protein